MNRSRLARLVALPLAASALAVAAPAASAAPSEPTARAAGACSAPFTVLHNDRIGSVSFPAGPYRVVTSLITCAQASQYFARFLDDYDGVLPDGWRLLVIGNARRFVKEGTKIDFQVTPGNPSPPPSSRTCPGTFTVEHNDRIGSLSLAKGQYRITRLSTSGRLTCAQASQQFALFLDRYPSGRLPKPWRLNARTATFTRSSGIGFTVKRVSSGGGGRHPNTGETRCPASFRVLNDDRIGALRLPAGNYAITVWGRLSCSNASRDFTAFLNDVSGNLPAPWVLEPETAAFIRGSQGFRVKRL